MLLTADLQSCYFCRNDRVEVTLEKVRRYRKKLHLIL